MNWLSCLSCSIFSCVIKLIKLMEDVTSNWCLNFRLVFVKLLFVYLCTVCFVNVQASAWYQDKIVRDKNADVSVTIMRWGVPDKVQMGEEIDRIVGQVASDKYKTVSLILQTTPVEGTFERLTINTGVHVFLEGRNAFCTLCRKGQRVSVGGGVNSIGAKTSGGCFFDISFERDIARRKLRLVDVLVDGQSVSYFVKFNISPDLTRSPARIPVSKTATLHPAAYIFETINVPVEKDDEVTDEKSGGAVTDSKDEVTDEKSDGAVTDSKSDSSVYSVRQDNEKKLKAISEKFDSKVDQLGAFYVSALEKLAKKVRKEEGWEKSVKVRMEIDRFSDSKEMSTSDISEMTEIKELQLKYMTHLNRIMKEKDDALKKLNK
jgi:hypothetical protein